jgi:hypothetical protein
MLIKRYATATLLALVTMTLPGCGPGINNPGNELPSGVVDEPKAGATLRPGPTLVGGWAMDDSGIREIRVYFDGRFKTSTVLAVARPDVAKARPRYARPDAMHGWNVLFDFGMAPGTHTLLVQAVDDQGATRDIGVIPVTVPE